MSFPNLFAPEESNTPKAHTFLLPLTFGASILSTYYAGGGVTVVRNSAGNYTITLPMAYQKLMIVGGAFLLASGTPLVPVVASETVSTDGKLVLETRNGSTATDPATGAVLYLTVTVSTDATVGKYQV